jgi:hypothetical protein
MVEEQVIPILRTADAAVAVEWYARLGFLKESEHRFAPELPAFVSVVRGRAKLFLSEHTGDARPDTLLQVWVDDLDRIAAELGVEPAPAAWNPTAREVEVHDPDGNRLRICQSA